MNNRIILTIAIPVYNVEKYLERCLDSIVSQVDAVSDLVEVLLVNDGSTDNSLKICQRYKEKYKYFRIINQTNHGLAYVRNVCIENASGEYISFIDSDDYVLPGLYEYALEMYRKKPYDILCFKHLDMYGENEQVPTINVDTAELKMLTANEALDVMFFDDYVDVITCNKIIKISLFSGISYPVGKLYEDMYTTYKYISKANTILCTNLPFYVYCHRLGSIGQSKFNERSMDLFNAAKETYEFICSKCKEHKIADIGFVYWAVVVANMMIKADYNDKSYINYVQNLSRKYRRQILECELLSWVRKFELILIGVNIGLYRMFYKSYMSLSTR